MLHRRFPRRAPPWWPQNEPWPPPGAPRFGLWHPARGFFWRIGLAFVLLFGLALGMFTFLFWSLAALLGRGGMPRQAAALLGPGGALFLALAIGALFFALRALRRLALPFADLVEAAQRVSDGDYAVRVSERGPRDIRSVVRAFNAMAARLQAQQAERRNLLADVTHELRTPLTIIQGNLEGLADGIYPLDREHVEPILEETHILSRLIEDLRTLALVESGALVLRKEPTDLGALIGETVASFRLQAETTGIALETEVATELPPADIDPQRVHEILVNLLANALHYTPRGGSIRVRCSAVEGKAGLVMVSVSDNGAGIAAEELAHIFDRFHKARDSGGSGLGLTIAKNLVAAHGGEIGAESVLGQGTTVRFTLPVQ